MNASAAWRWRSLALLFLALSAPGARADPKVPAARVLGRGSRGTASAVSDSIGLTYFGPGRIVRFENLPSKVSRFVVVDGTNGYELWTDAAGRLTLSGPPRPGKHRIDVLPPDQTRRLTYFPMAPHAGRRARIGLALLALASAAAWVVRRMLRPDADAPATATRSAFWPALIAAILLAGTAAAYAKRVWRSPALPLPRSMGRDMELFRRSQFILGWRQPGLRIMSDQRIYDFAGWLQAHGTRPDLVNPEHPPLGKYLLGAAERAAGTPVAATFAAGMLALAGLSVLGRRMFGSWAPAFVGAAITAAGPLLVSYTVNTYLEIFVLALAAWGLVAVASAAESPPSMARVLLLDLLLGAGFALKWSFAVFGLVVVGTLLRARRARAAAAFVAGIPLAGAVYVLSYARSFAHAMSPGDFLSFQEGIAKRWAIVNASAKPSTWGLWRILATGVPDYTPARLPHWSLFWPAAGLLGIAGAVLAVRGRDAAGTACGIWFLGQMFFFTAAPSWERYLIPILPFAVLLALQLATRTRSFRRLVGAT